MSDTKRRQVIYHRADNDGMFSAAVFKLLTPRTWNLTLVGWDLGDPQPEIDPDADQVIVVDLPYTVHPSLENDPRLIWIDHHASVINSAPEHLLKNPNNYLVDGVAACRLAYQWLLDDGRPTKTVYKTRGVTEPEILTLIGEYDVWDLHDERSVPLQYGIAAEEPEEDKIGWRVKLLQSNGTGTLLKSGEAALTWHKKIATEVANERGYMVEFEGLNFFVLASCHARGSLWWGENIPKEADALLGWRYSGGVGGRVNVSLYHAPGHSQHDLSEIAQKWGGGGHKGACGFELDLATATELFK